MASNSVPGLCFVRVVQLSYYFVPTTVVTSFGRPSFGWLVVPEIVSATFEIAAKESISGLLALNTPAQVDRNHSACTVRCSEVC